ncbi:MAG: 4-hydroxybenzoate octaprenyltransferase [SAR202 cluster bacterium]|nr:4-hydroxybenzoate octaprenyltransferase [SAR202 cluster bacterium]
MAYSMSIKSSKILLFFQAIKFQESIFALPFAYMGMVLAADGLPSGTQFIWITIAMIMARTVGMTANRVIDKNIDSLNPRTSSRHLPMGILKSYQLIIPGVIALLIFIFASYQLNFLAFILSPVAIGYLIIYPYTKRFTWAANIFLGWALAIAPAAAWIGVKGTLDAEVVFLSAAVAFWAGSFDIIYHCQDIDFQKNNSIYSVAKKFGVEKAFVIAKVFDLIALILLIIFGIMIGSGLPFFIACIISMGLLFYKYILVKSNDLTKLGMAFMRINSLVSTTMLIGTLLSIFVWDNF